MTLKALLLPICLFLSLGCSGSAGQHPIDPPPPPPPPPPKFRLEITGNGLYYAGSQPGIVSAIRGVESPEPIYWTVEGPGYLALDPLGKQPYNTTGSLYFIPPTTIPGGGDTTSKVYYTTKDLYNGGMKKSPEMIMQLKTLKAPMSFTTSHPLSITLKPGEVMRLDATPVPVPFDFYPDRSVTWTFTPNRQVADPGTSHIAYAFLDFSVMEYKAPTDVPVEFDLVVTATMHDSWFNLDPVLTWTLHVKKP